ncbi:hypothetical protein KI387_027507 [Taxus chinensis]|uniref:Cytochrome P450 n=1 Tax=Taxus chinensis TaxID=29808 RepID=A0AA38L9L0_TAXCH|nr:hypothetical protein KI387_027507 [Taxus chinensis]
MVRSNWLESGEGIRSVDVTNRISSLPQNIVCRMLSGRTFSDDELNGGVGFKDMLSLMAAVTESFVIGDYILFLEWFDLEGISRRMRVVQKIFDGFAEKVMDEHINRRREKAEDENRVKDMVDVLLDRTESESQSMEKKITRVHIKAIISDTFQLHPPLPLLLPHELMEVCVVDGYYIPPKTMLLLNVWATGRDENVWEDPLQFNPEIFMGKTTDVKGQDFELIPFGTG